MTIPCAGHGQSICCVLQVSDSKLGEPRGPHQIGKPSQRNSRAGREGGREEGGREGGGVREGGVRDGGRREREAGREAGREGEGDREGGRELLQNSNIQSEQTLHALPTRI